MTITAQHISFSVGQKSILHDLSFTIAPGEVTVVLGPNGAGKTTLLRLLSGEQMPTTGQILVDHKTLSSFSLPQLAKCRGVLSQHYNLDLPFACEEIVMMGRYPHFSGHPSSNDHDIVQHCMQAMQVEQFTGRLYQTLSGGEQQRVQMARVLAQLHETNSRSIGGKLLLLDEPTASLDVLHQQACLHKARQMAQQGFTVVIILHDLNLAAQFADNIILLKNGQLVVQGNMPAVLTPEHISTAYDMEVEAWHHAAYDFPVLVPLNHKKPVVKPLPKNNSYELDSKPFVKR
jgi:iron complex transport system ATP-binding protein